MKSKIIVDACCHVPDAHLKGRAIRGNSACGVLIINEYGDEKEFSKFLGEMTPPEAEFNGLIFALDNGVDLTTGEIEVWMDNELVIKWMKKEYRMHKPHIRPLFDKAKQYENRYKSVEYFWHPEKSTFAQRVHKIASREYEKNIK